MKRRSFVKTSIVGTTLSAFVPVASAVASSGPEKKEQLSFYELRVYTFKSAEQQKLTEDWLQHAAIPALNRLGSKTIGVFREMKPSELPKLYVLIPFDSVNDLIAAETKLLEDKTYVAAAAAYLNATAAAPAYDRIESSLLRAFEKMPSIVTPSREARIFELRRYESATELAGKKKIEMFNDKGEIDIFRRVGLSPVFFGETLIGTLRPNLTYMLTYRDMAAHDTGWKAFGNDSQWKTIKAIPEYADDKIVSHITSIFLVPADASQI